MGPACILPRLPPQVTPLVDGSLAGRHLETDIRRRASREHRHTEYVAKEIAMSEPSGLNRRQFIGAAAAGGVLLAGPWESRLERRVRGGRVAEAAAGKNSQGLRRPHRRHLPVPTDGRDRKIREVLGRRGGKAGRRQVRRRRNGPAGRRQRGVAQLEGGGRRAAVPPVGSRRRRPKTGHGPDRSTRGCRRPSSPSPSADTAGCISRAGERRARRSSCCPPATGASWTESSA